MLFPNKFKNLPRYVELEALVQSITAHPAMRVETTKVQGNMVRASLAFTLCFYANLMASLQSVLKQAKGRHPLVVRRETSLLHLFLQLAGEELATDNLPLGQPEVFSPHFVPMYEAALQAGVDVSPLDRLMEALEAGDYAPDTMTTLGFHPALNEYLRYSADCATRYEAAFATIALRELTLSANFRVILDSLPDDPHFAKYRLFLSGHIDLDEGGHAQLMAVALEAMHEPERALDVMITFYEKRLAVYDVCLEDRNLF